MPQRTLSLAERNRLAIIRGAEQLGRAVGCTLGPGGHVVLIDDTFGRVIATKDGVTVARAVHLPDQHEQLGASILADAALKVADDAGDGTTTCVVFAVDLLKRCHSLVQAGHCPVAIGRQLGELAEVTRKILLSRSADPTGRLLQVAATSCNGDPRIIDAISAAVGHAGFDGVILIKEGHGDRIEVRAQSGIRFDRGWVSPALAPESGVIEFGLSAVLVAHKPLMTGASVIPHIRHAAGLGVPLVVVAEQVAGTALETVIGNCRSGVSRIAVVKCPGFDDRLWDNLHDVAVATGATVVDLATGSADPRWLGTCASFRQDRHSSVIQGGGGDAAAVSARLASLVASRQALPPGGYDYDRLTERIGRLRGRVAEIHAGAPTPAEAREIKDRIEDAARAVVTAMRDGIHPGGGTALLRAAREIPATAVGKAFSAALSEPARRILRNAGQPDHLAALAADVSDAWSIGVDASTGLRRDMLEIPDCTATLISAVASGSSAASVLLTAEASILLSPVTTSRKDTP